MHKKLLVILGPTSSGKSNLAVDLAKKYNGEVISADSRQVYKGLDIGSGKITKKEMCGVPHHLLDVVNPKKVFNVSNFKKLADEAIEDILSRGKLPIIAGGTGFYIDAVVDNIGLSSVKPNKTLRIRLAKKDAEKLMQELKKLDPKRAKLIDSNNKVRIIRSIEIAKKIGKVPEVKKNRKHDVLKIGLTWPEEKLKERISTRITNRLKAKSKNNMLKEAVKLHEDGLSWKRMISLGLEYRFMALHLTNKLSHEEMVKQLETSTWHFVKRQMTWWKRDKEIKWVDMSKPYKTKVGKVVKDWLG